MRREWSWMAKCLHDLERNRIAKMNHLETFLANIDPGGAVGGRFMRIFDASGASDARRIFDKSMAIGSSDSMMPPSSWNDTEIKNREMNGIYRSRLRIRSSHTPDLPILRSEGPRSEHDRSPLIECSSFSESLPPGLSSDTSVTISQALTADRALVWVGTFNTLFFGRDVNGLSSFLSTKNFGFICGGNGGGCCCCW